MANSKDVLLSCYDGKIMALVDTKKFRKQGITASEKQSMPSEPPILKNGQIPTT